MIEDSRLGRVKVHLLKGFSDRDFVAREQCAERKQKRGSIAGFLVKEKEVDLVPFETAALGIPGRQRPCFIDSQSPALKVLAVHFGYSLIAAILHLYEAKTFGAAGAAIGNDTNRFNRTCLAEKFLELSLRRFKR